MTIVIKSSGDEEEFSEAKLIRSLERAGASQSSIKIILEKIRSEIKDKMTTKEIYEKTFEFLKTLERSTAGRYNLKQALFEFGPSGYPFEHFVGFIFRERGYDVEVGKVVKGECIEHEIDVIARKGNIHFLVECKFHLRSALYTPVQVPLYVKSRFDDLNECARKSEKGSCHFRSGYIFSNTHFSRDGIAYAKCKDLNLVSWNYPRNKGLANMIDELKIHPVTCLTLLKKKEKQFLLQEGVVVCRDLVKRIKILKEINIDDVRISNILDEAKNICN